MKNYNEVRKERKSKNKGLWYSIGLHTIVVALVFLPFINSEKEAVTEFEERVVVDFSTASSLKGASANVASANNTVHAPDKKTKPVKKIEPKAPEKVMTEKESVLSAPEVEEPVEEEVEVKEKPVEEKDPMPKEPETDRKEKEVPEVKPAPIPEKNEKGEKGRGTDRSNGKKKGTASDKSNGSGNADTGEGKSNKGEGKDNRGNGLFGDIGELSRPVVDRPNVSKMIRENSIIKVRICISRSGRVVDFAYEPEGSEVKDRKTVNETLGIISQYRFERVVGGPKLECGIFTVKVDMGN